MPVTNLHNAKHLDLKPVVPADIHVGLKIYYSGGAGRVVKMRCESVDDSRAVFANTQRGLPRKATIEFNAPDLSSDEFEQLEAAIAAYESASATPTEAQQHLVTRAYQLGYVKMLTVARPAWTEPGLAGRKQPLATA